MLGFSVIPGNTRVRTQSAGLVRLDQLSGSGPAGPAGPPGPAVDTSQYYNKGEVDIRLSLKEDNIVSTPGTGTGLFSNGMLRKLVAGNSTSISINGEDNLVVDATGSSSGIPSTIATFESTGITHVVPTTCNLGLTVANTLAADEVHTDTICANYFYFEW